MSERVSKAVDILRAEALVAEIPLHVVSGVLLEVGCDEPDLEADTRAVLKTLVVDDALRVCELKDDFHPWPEKGEAAYKRLLPVLFRKDPQIMIYLISPALIESAV